MTRTKVLILTVVLLTVILLTGCGPYLQVINLSEVCARVVVSVPDSSGSLTKELKNGDSADIFSSMSGTYTVQVLSCQDYRQLLVNLQEEITKKLWEERETLTGPDVATLVERLTEIQNLLDELAEEAASCQGTLSEEDTVTATITWDPNQNNWSLSCP